MGPTRCRAVADAGDGSGSFLAGQGAPPEFCARCSSLSAYSTNTHELPNRLPSSSTSVYSNHHTSPQLPIHELEYSITEIQITSSLIR